MNEQERFWAKVDKAGECWIWTGWQRGKGYGGFETESGTKVSAHRYSYEMAFGPVPAGLHVCHRCDNPPCVRPEHLFAGSNGDNMKDMYRKGRRIARPTERPAYVQTIFHLRSLGRTHGEIATSVGMSRTGVGKILRGERHAAA